jgi:hypothetical protein
MDQSNAFRLKVSKIVNSTYFENFILFLIVLSSILLAIEDPLDNPSSNFNKILFGIDIAINVQFGVEAIMKIVSFGFLLTGETAYIRNPWNILDFSIVIVSVRSC